MIRLFPHENQATEIQACYNVKCAFGCSHKSFKHYKMWLYYLQNRLQMHVCFTVYWEKRVATEKLHTDLAYVGENLLFTESCIERLSQKHLMSAHNIKRILN